jgi:hypothetical protein
MSTNGNTWVAFKLGDNTFTLPYANITSWDARAIYAEDGYTQIRYETTISGSALVSYGTSTYTTLANLLKKEPGRVDEVKIWVTADGATEAVYESSGPDALRGPLMSMTVTEISGRQAAMITFTIVGHAMAEEDDCPIVSHRWVQSFTLDAAGHMTRTVTGSIVLDLSNTNADTTYAENNTAAQVNGKAPWADLFRKAILPTRPPDSSIWRRESQTFAYNESGNSLIYTIVDTQARIKLPDSALTGNCEFTYERNSSDLTFAILRFNCDLEGPVNGDVRHMMWSAVVLAQTRIPFRSAMIDRIVFSEQDMMTRSKVRVEIQARCYAWQGDVPAPGTYPPVPLADYIGKFFTVVRTCPEYPDSYGGYTGIASVPHWYNNNLSAKTPGVASSLPVATVINAITDYCSPGTPTTSMVAPDTNFDSANAAMNQGPFSTLPRMTNNSSGQPAGVERSQTVTSVYTNTKMHRLQTLYTQGVDFVFQAGKASTILEEVTTVKGVNNPPQRIFRPIPAGFMVVKDDWKVNFGDVDTGGQRTFIGVYTRTLKSYDGGGATSNGYSTVSGRRQWWSPTQTVIAPASLGFNTDGDGQNTAVSVFNANTNAAAYNVGTPQDYV